MKRTAALASISALLLCLLLSAQAGAEVTKYSGKQAKLESDDAADNISLSCIGGQAQSEGVNLVACGELEVLTIEGNGGNDSISISNISAADFPSLRLIMLDGGPGTDTIIGSQLADRIQADSFDTVDGGPGDDNVDGGARVAGGDGNDVLEHTFGPAAGGPGNDAFVSPSSSEPLDGGPGLDSLEFKLATAEAVEELAFSITDSALSLTFGSATATVSLSSVDRVSMDLPAGNQTVDASSFTGTLDADGGPGNDVLTGGAGEDTLKGGLGDDTLTGNGNFDLVDGGEGNDLLQLQEGVADRGVCGPGVDTAVADAVDSLAECESVSLPPAPPAPPAPSPPSSSMSGSAPPAAPPTPTPPNTRILAGPKKVAAGKVATFKFSSTVAGGGFRCGVDKAKATPCSSPYALKTGKLKPGRHTLTVFAVDAAGNADPTPATTTLTVEPKKHRSKR